MKKKSMKKNVMKCFSDFIALLLYSTLFGLVAPMAHAQGSSIRDTVLPGKGDVSRTVVTYNQLFAGPVPSTPVDDTAGFAVPANAAEPMEVFEGTLTLKDLATSGNFTKFSDVFGIIPEGESAWKHLPAFNYQFVQSGSYLIPAVQGLTITGSPSWNYILGPGRVWREDDDDGYIRASLPFSIIQRNQNCVHNGEMTFLFSNTKSPKVSNVYFQITQETCYPMKFNMWGIASATYTPATVAGVETLEKNHATEILSRMPTKPFEALAEDFPHSGINLSGVTAAYRHPEDITTYGLVINGTNYTGGCRTRFGTYAFCGDMRLPSYSIAKSVFAGVALMRLGELYGTGVYSQLIKDFIPESSSGGKWNATTFNNTSDMATGNYNLEVYEADEDSPTMDKFLVDESSGAKLADAFAFKQNYAPPGTKWIYQSSATFVLTQTMNAYLKQQRGKSADVFDLVRDEVYKPLHISAGGLTTIRTDNSTTGAPSGYYGLFFNQDDIAKIGSFLNNSGGVIDRAQVLEPTRLKEALFRSPNAADVGVPILGSSSASALGPPQLGSNKPLAPKTRRYAHGFWGKYMTTAEFPQYSCNFWVSLMAGYGGNIVALLPNGATFYIFSDGREFPWVDSVREIAKLAPMCH
jgi:CubicO group peptidase (beta-lactamase class C family)